MLLNQELLAPVFIRLKPFSAGKMTRKTTKNDLSAVNSPQKTA